MFKEDADIEEYTSSVLAYIYFCTDSVLPIKLDSTVWCLLKAQDVAHRSGDLLAYRGPRRVLKKGIKEAKHTTYRWIF